MHPSGVRVFRNNITSVDDVSLRVARAFLAPAADTVAVDSSTHLVYFPLQTGPQLQIMKPQGR
jgi:hypothetical protein